MTPVSHQKYEFYPTNLKQKRNRDKGCGKKIWKSYKIRVVLT